MLTTAIQRRAAHLNARRHELYDIQLYLVLLYEPPDVVRRATRLRGLWKSPASALRSWLSAEHTIDLLESEIDRAIDTLQHKAKSFEVQVSECRPRRLDKHEAFRFFRQLVNYDALKSGPDEADVRRASRLLHSGFRD